MKDYYLFTCNVFLIIAASTLIAACGGGNNPQPPPSELVKVTVRPVESRAVKVNISAASTLKATREAALSFLQGGYVETAGYEMGDRVEAGDTLAALDAAALKANLKKAESALQKARRDYAKALRLQGAEVVPTGTLEDAETARSLAEADYNAAEFALQHGYITAPFSGSVAARFIEPGQIVGPGTPVYKLVQIDRLEITLGIAQRETKALRLGDRAEISLFDGDGTIVRGKVTALPSSGEMTLGLLPVKLEFANPGGWLPGMAVKAVITAGAPRRILAISADAVRVASDGQAYYYRFRPETGDVVKVPLQLGKPSGGYIELISGAGEGDLAVCGGVDRVRDGDNVTVETAGMRDNIEREE